MMKRFGYTLAEALIALAIVGVVAALTLPMVNKFMPDTNKVTYLKTYDSIVEAVHQMATNTKLYPLIWGDYAYTNAPLANIFSIDDITGVPLADPTKFCQILALHFGEKNPSCTPSPTWTPSFTSNGVQFVVRTDYALLPYTDQVNYRSIIEIDVNGDEGENSYLSANCSNPDRFRFEVAADGKVIAVDQKGQEYLATRTNAKKLTREASTKLREKLEIVEDKSLSEEDRIKDLIALNDNSQDDNSGADDGSGDDSGSGDDGSGSGDDGSGSGDDGSGSGDDGSGGGSGLGGNRFEFDDQIKPNKECQACKWYAEYGSKRTPDGQYYGCPYPHTCTLQIQDYNKADLIIQQN